MRKINIYKRKDGRFEGRIYLGRDDDGKRKYKSYYGISAEDVQRKYELSQCFITSDNISSGITVGELIREWLYAASFRVKESTLANYRMKAETHIIPVFGEMPCYALNSGAVYAFIERKLQQGLSVRYVSDIIVLMKSVVRYGNRIYHFENVFDGIVIQRTTSLNTLYTLQRN